MASLKGKNINIWFLEVVVVWLYETVVSVWITLMTSIKPELTKSLQRFGNDTMTYKIRQFKLIPLK